MKALATFILRGPGPAVLVAVGTAVLAMMLPPLSVISGAVIALVTLRNGMRAGAVVMAGSTIFVGLMAFMSLGNVMPGVVFLVVLWLPLWILSWVLRETRSLALATTAAGVLGVIGVIAVYAIVGDVSAWWLQTLLALLEPAMEASGAMADPAMMQEMLSDLSKIMTGIAAAGISLNAVTCLYLGRVWQAQLYNPGGFREEFHALRLGQRLALASLGFIALSLLPLGMVSHVAGEIVIVILSLYVLQGVALLHAVVAQRSLHVAWLVLFYVVVFFIMPHLVVFVAVMGLLDAWADFRQRLAKN